MPAQIEGLAAIARVVHVGQTPIGRTPRSTPATYAGVFAAIRELFAELPDARMRGFGAERFSFNVKGGRCERCQGDGVVRVDMQFLPDVLRALRRVRRHALRARDARAALSRAQHRRRARRDASTKPASCSRSAARRRSARQPARGRARLPAARAGATTLSAGEAQRLRLARELARRDDAATLYALDEPTAGLHPSEVELLAQVLEGLVERGHTVVVIEHNLDLVSARGLGDRPRARRRRRGRYAARRAARRSRSRASRNRTPAAVCGASRPRRVDAARARQRTIERDSQGASCRFGKT